MVADKRQYEMIVQQVETGSTAKNTSEIFGENLSGNHKT